MVGLSPNVDLDLRRRRRRRRCRSCRAAFWGRGEDLEDLFGDGRRGVLAAVPFDGGEGTAAPAAGATAAPAGEADGNDEEEEDDEGAHADPNHNPKPQPKDGGWPGELAVQERPADERHPSPFSCSSSAAATAAEAKAELFSRQTATKHTPLPSWWVLHAPNLRIRRGHQTSGLLHFEQAFPPNPHQMARTYPARRSKGF